MVDWLVGLLVDWLVGWLVGRLVGWLVGRLVGWQVSQQDYPSELFYSSDLFFITTHSTQQALFRLRPYSTFKVKTQVRIHDGISCVLVCSMLRMSLLCLLKRRNKWKIESTMVGFLGRQLRRGRDEPSIFN